MGVLVLSKKSEFSGSSNHLINPGDIVLIIEKVIIPC